MLLTYVCAVIFASTAPNRPVWEPQPLAYRWPLNEALSYRFTSENTLKMTGLPMGDVTQTIVQDNTLILTPRDVAQDGATTLEAAYQSISIQMQPFLDPTRYAFDSQAAADPSENPLRAPVITLIGRPFTIVLGPDGAVRRIDGFAEIADSMNQATPSGAKFAPLLRAAFSEQAATKQFEIAFHRLPPGPVEPGASWPTAYDTTMPQIGTLSAQGQSTLQSLESGIATIDTALDITLRLPAPGEPANPMMRNLKLDNARGSGQSLFDADKGLLRRFTGKVSVPFTSPAPTGSDKPAMNVSVLIDTATSVERIDTK